MGFHESRRPGAALALAAFAGLATAACTDSAEEITSVPFVSFNSAIGTAGTGLPGGAVEVTLTEEGDPRQGVGLEVDFTNLESLQGGATYRLWLRDDAGVRPVTGDYTQLRITTTSPSPGEFVVDTTVVSSETGAGGFAGGPGTDVHHVSLSVPEGVGADAYLFVSIEPSASPSAPSDARPLWVAIPDESAEARVMFGRFDPADPASSRAYVNAGTGLMSVRKESGSFVSLIGEVQELGLPPVGYYYAAWLVGADGTELSAGELTSPPPDAVPLTDADRVAIGGARPAPVVISTGIVEARTQISREQAGVHFGAFSQYQITLEPKQGVAGRAPSVVLAAAIPEAVVGDFSAGGTQ